ncbi:MAG: helicase-related protein, partial [Alphaproteobacteria bacterium]|nr:helicase-related protein [Alphaproteobacteria bacterium]
MTLDRPQAPAAASQQSNNTRTPLRAADDGRIVALLGPTNTGKTHFAIERMLGHSSGMIGLPLRLLAREVYDKILAQKGPARVALITGEEKIVPARPSYWVCTVESMPMDIDVDFLAVDEIQLAADPDRGHIFTDRLLRARGRHETMFMGADNIKGLIRQLLPNAEFNSRTRMSRLSFAGAKKLSRLPRRSAIVAFSASDVYAIAELIRRRKGGAAVVMGALSPRTRNAQVAMYQNGEVDYIVATDAIGMGLNMAINHVAFAALSKFDGMRQRRLFTHEIAQIAGRAGRHMNDGTFGLISDGYSGSGLELSQEEIEAIEDHRFKPLDKLQWRNAGLDYSSLDGLIRSLEASPDHDRLNRAPEAVDLAVLKMLAADESIRANAGGPAALKLLWQACQIPDFRKTMVDEHARLVGRIFRHLSTEEARLPENWVAGQVGGLDRAEGDIDTIANRIAHIRTWTYIANRPSRDAMA